MFLTLVLGIVEFGRLLWTLNDLQFAVEQGARCAVVKPASCATASEVQSYVAGRVFAPGVASGNVTVASASCGTQVSASAPFTFVASPLFSYAITLTAQACYPA